MNHHETPLLTSREVAGLLHVSPATLTRWRQSGTGPKWANLNGIPRYRSSDVSAFVETQTRVSH